MKHAATMLDYFVGNADGRGLIRIEIHRDSEGAGTHIASMPRGRQSESYAAALVTRWNACAKLDEARETLKAYDDAMACQAKSTADMKLIVMANYGDLLAERMRSLLAEIDGVK